MTTDIFARPGFVGRGKQSRFQEARAPTKPKLLFISGVASSASAVSREQRGARGLPPVLPHFSYFPAQIGGCCGARDGAGMAARVALLLGVLLATHRPGDAGEAPRAPHAWGWRGQEGVRFWEAASCCCLWGLNTAEALLQAGAVILVGGRGRSVA